MSQTAGAYIGGQLSNLEPGMDSQINSLKNLLRTNYLSTDSGARCRFRRRHRGLDEAKETLMRRQANLVLGSGL